MFWIPLKFILKIELIRGLVNGWGVDMNDSTFKITAFRRLRYCYIFPIKSTQVTKWPSICTEINTPFQNSQNEAGVIYFSCCHWASFGLSTMLMTTKRITRMSKKLTKTLNVVWVASNFRKLFRIYRKLLLLGKFPYHLNNK